jgi:hypothetical protein
VNRQHRRHRVAPVFDLLNNLFSWRDGYTHINLGWGELEEMVDFMIKLGFGLGNL